jgi:N-methylhydantoinase B
MKADPTRLEIFKNLFHSVAEEMGAALRRAAFSPNIKERRDYSCAVFDGEGQVLAMGDHMPVHLGSMPMSVAAAMNALTLGPRDVALLNDPYAGGTHLPDLTMVMPVYTPRTARPSFYIANRAHHADIGGAHPGSMGLSREIFQEGLRVPPVKILEHGRTVPDVMSLILANVRTPREREGDLTAQIAACRIGERRLIGLVSKYGRSEVLAYGRHLLDYSSKMMAAALATIPDGTYREEDFLDDDGVSNDPQRIAVTIRVRRRRAEVDFTGSAPQCAGSVNAVAAITQSAK